MSNHPGVNDVLGLLDTLKEAVHEFGVREAKLENEFRLASVAETKAHEAEIEALSVEFSERITQAAVGFQTGTEACRSRFERRKTKINQAHYAARKRILEAISEQEGRQKNRIQENVLEAERRRDTERRNAESALEEFNLRLSGHARIRRAYGAGRAQSVSRLRHFSEDARQRGAIAT